MSTRDAWDELDDVVTRDAWDDCEAWGLAHLETPGAAGAAGCVCDALHQDRPLRAREEHGPGLNRLHRALFAQIVRLRRVASTGGAVFERGHLSSLRYGVIVESGDARVAVAVAGPRATLVAADATTVRTARGQRQLLDVLGALAYATDDDLKPGRDFSLAAGHVCHVPRRPVVSAPLLASRYRVAEGRTLAPWLDLPDVVAVTPAGGRIALTPLVGQVEELTRRLQQQLEIGAPWRPRHFDELRDTIERLRAYGWTPEVEPLSARAEALLAALDALGGDEDPTPASLGWSAVGWDKA